MAQRRKQLLLVDDNPHDVELAQAAVEVGELDCDLRVARDGAEALACLRAPGALPDLVLLDLNMPRMGGLEVLQIVKRDSALRHVPIVIFSTSGEVADRARASAYGADGYIRKPESFDATVSVFQGLERRWLEQDCPA